MSAPLPAGSTIGYAGIIGPGQTLPVALTGTMFYLTVATSPLFIRPSGISPWCQFQPGTGTETPSQFSQLEVYNVNSVPVTFQVVSGFAPFIDHRLVPNQLQQNVIKIPTWTAIMNNGFTTTLVDQTGTGAPFTDAYGNEWLAIQRQSISISIPEVVSLAQPNNVLVYTSPGGVLLLDLIGPQSEGTSGSQSLPYVVSISGNLLINIFGDGGPQIGTALVFEIYSAISPGFAGTPPS